MTQPTSYQMWTIKLEGQHRLRLPSAAALVLPWLRLENPSTPAVGFLGREGGLLVCAATSPLAVQRAALAVDHVEDRRLARFLASSWDLVIHHEPGRFSLTLPREARLLALVPEAGQVAVALAAGGELEIWRGEDWVERVREAWAHLPTPADESEV